MGFCGAEAVCGSQFDPVMCRRRSVFEKAIAIKGDGKECSG